MQMLKSLQAEGIYFNKF